MNPVIRVVLLFLHVIWMSSLSGAAHTQCDPDKAKVPVSVTVGDGSTPTGPNYILWSSGPGCEGYSTFIGEFPWGAAMATPYYIGDGAFKIFGDGPYRSPPGPGFYHCERDGEG